jgi:hypothetical protein
MVRNFLENLKQTDLGLPIGYRERLTGIQNQPGNVVRTL